MALAEDLIRGAGRFGKKAGSFGKKAAVGVPAALAIGVGTAIYKSHPLKGAVNTALDMTYSTPDFDGKEADNVMIGRNITFSQMFPSLTFFDPSIIPTHNLRQALHSRSLGDISAPNHLHGGQLGDYDSQGRPEMNYFNQRSIMGNMSNNAYNDTSEKNGLLSNRNNAYALGREFRPAPARPSLNANGDMVFGMYNNRQGQ